MKSICRGVLFVCFAVAVSVAQTHVFVDTNSPQLIQNKTLDSTNTFNGTFHGTATYLFGGTAGSLPYQSAPSVTAFLAGNTTATDKVLVSNSLVWSLSGTPAINITGNAGTVTNGVVTTGSYANPSWLTSLAWGKLTGVPTLVTSTSGLSDWTNVGIANGYVPVWNSGTSKWTPGSVDLSAYMPLAGGTFTGNVNMGAIGTASGLSPHKSSQSFTFTNSYWTGSAAANSVWTLYGLDKDLYISNGLGYVNFPGGLSGRTGFGSAIWWSINQTAGTFPSVVSTAASCGSSTPLMQYDGTCAAAPSSMVYPGAGVPNSTGSAWGTSYTVSNAGAANALAQFDSGGALNIPTKDIFGLTGNFFGGLQVFTPNAATSSVNRSSPNIETVAQYWNGSASTQDAWVMTGTLASGTNPASTLYFTHLGSPGAASASFPSVQSRHSSCGASTPVMQYDGTCAAAPSSMVYPGAGVPNSTGSAWGTSYTVGTAANNLLQLNGSGILSLGGNSIITGPLFTSTTGFATSGTNYSSNNYAIQSSYWNGANPAIDSWNLQAIPGAGTNPTSVLYISHAGSVGVATVAVPALSLNGIDLATTLSGKVGTSTTVNGHALSGNVTVSKSDVGLGNVTNDAQTQAAVVPNTAPAAGKILVGNAGGTAYAPVSITGAFSLSSNGVSTLSSGLPIYSSTLMNQRVIRKVITNGGLTGNDNTGDSFVAPVGTASYVATTSSEARYSKWATAASTNADAGPASSLTVYQTVNPYYESYVLISSTTNVRAWIGPIVNGGGCATTGSNDTAGSTSGAAFRYSTAAGDTHWMAISGAYSGSPTITDTGVTPDTAGHRFGIYVTSGGTSTFYIDGTLVATNGTGITGAAYPFECIRTLENEAKFIGVAWRTTQMDK